MTRPTTIKVIKRGQMEQTLEKFEITPTVKLNDRDVRREAAAAVEGWIAEFQESHRAEHLAAKLHLNK